MRGWTRRARWLAAALLCPGACAASAEGPEPPRFGWVEHVAVDATGRALKAKLDTGARTSSLSALEVETFRDADGADRVRFRLEGPDGEPAETLERPVSRWVRIKRHDMKPDRRPVIELAVCLGDIRKTVEFSLADRTKFNYPVLLGRNFLKGVAVVDARSTFTREPACDPPAEASPPRQEDPAARAGRTD